MPIRCDIAFCFSLTGITFVPGVSSNMKAMTFHYGWKNFGGGYETATYTEIQGICYLQGLIKDGWNGHMSTLPENCRPKERLIFNMIRSDSVCRVDISTNGAVTTHGGTRGWISLAGINFVTYYMTNDF